MKYSFCVLFVLMALSIKASEISECIDSKKIIDDKVKCLPGVTVVSSSSFGGDRKLVLQFEQPVDHKNLKSEKFKQKLVLIHIGEKRPMVLQTSGYEIFSERRSRLASEFDTNQIQVEHRFFAKSKPKKVDWSKLDIKQSADDFHAITVAFKNIYKKPWVNTGASKGGMTSVYHRYFYPDDLAGTVADVAPLSFARGDKRYIGFVRDVGGHKFESCRNELERIQIKALENKEELSKRLVGNYDKQGGKEAVFQVATTELAFVFWQYQKVSSSVCDILAEKVTLDDIFSFIEIIGQPSDDKRYSRFSPYYYQAYTELGYPGDLVDNFDHLLDPKNDSDETLSKTFFGGTPIKYSNKSMNEVKKWAETKADNVMYVYGEFDPWTAGEFPISKTGKNVYKYNVKGGTHAVNFNYLSGAELREAKTILRSWFGLSPSKSKKKKSKLQQREQKSLSLDEVEEEFRKKFKLM